MVRDANVKQAYAEKLLKEANLKARNFIVTFKLFIKGSTFQICRQLSTPLEVVFITLFL